MTGRKVPASEPATLGLVNKVVADTELMNSAIGLAQEICSKGPGPIQMIKFSMNRDSGVPDLAYPRGADLGSRAFEDLQKRRAESFFQGQKPRFNGR